MITDDVKKYIDQSVLCWLATSNAQNEPNVSPKEMFTCKEGINKPIG
jgi:predicted pyridoxine 5'-phosphate oxidase superfamily flavin-nucleotide-binding protein